MIDPITAPVVEPYEPKHLKRWKMPSHYFGETWEGWYVFLGRTRDSENLDISNYETAIELLGGENTAAAEELRGVLIVEEHHWAVGWVQWIGIYWMDYDLLRKADEIAERLADYPVLDDEDYSRREWESQMNLIEQEFSFWSRNLDGDDEPTDEEKDFIVYKLCQQQPDDDSCPDDDEMEEMYQEVHGHLLTCPNPDFGGHYLDSERCPCGRFHFWNWITSLIRRWQS